MSSDAFALPKQSAHLDRYRRAVLQTLAALQAQNFAQRLWQKDASLWSADAAVQAKISNRLGWLTSPQTMSAECARIRQFVRRLQQARFTHVLLLGMGGSSMCPEVCRTTFGMRPGFLDLLVLDTTDPATIRAREQAVDLTHTLFIVSSKSGTTIETISLYKYFYERLRTLKGETAGENFIAITDAGTPLAQQASERKFRDCFLNPADIGGRFSALSFFGLVPAALVGIDIAAFLARAQAMMQACGPDVPLEENPGVVLGAFLATLYQRRRDKVTFVLMPPIASFGYWVEQLVAESLGKLGKGIVPLEGEPLSAAAVYANDRVFVAVHLGRRADGSARRLRALERAGHPVVWIKLDDKLDLAAELYRWEVAIATAGALMQLNPFDEPNVQESKDNTDRLLREFRATGRLPEESPTLAQGRLRVFAPAALAQKLSRGTTPRDGLKQLFANFLRLARLGDYVGLTAYIQPAKAHQRALAAIRQSLHQDLRRAVTVGYGPRFLHSTGQLHKGGPNNGLYFQLVATDAPDLDAAVPGEPFSFSSLKQAQALGDFAALRDKQRRVLRVHLGDNVLAGLAEFGRLLRAAVALTGARKRTQTGKVKRRQPATKRKAKLRSQK